MANADQIIEILRKQSPENYACDWDNVGLLVGNGRQDVSRIFIALDANLEAIREAKEAGADMILTHHPLIFGGIKKVSSEDRVGAMVADLIRSGIICYAMHTNFDVLGMADAAADRIGLKDRSVLLQTVAEECEKHMFINGIGRVGRFSEKMSLRACAELVKKAFGLDRVRVYGGLEVELEVGAICPGSGKSVVGNALEAGAQVLITGDIDHHTGLDCVDMGMAIIDGGHYGLEKLFIPFLKQYLERELRREGLAEIDVIAQPERPPFRSI